MLYIARAHFKAGNLRQAKLVLLKVFILYFHFTLELSLFSLIIIKLERLNVHAGSASISIRPARALQSLAHTARARQANAHNGAVLASGGRRSL